MGSANAIVFAQAVEGGVAAAACLVYVLFFVVVGAIGIAGTVLWIWMLVDCLTKEPSEGNDKVVWALVIVLTHWVGALIYLLVRRPKRIEELGQ